MIYLAWLVTLGISFYLGYKLREITSKIEAVERALKEKVDRKPEPKESQSNLIDLTDPVAEAKYQHDKMMRELND